jgi:predicted AAA+ superfamily ATPase
MTQISDYLVEFNPWWKGSFFHSSKDRVVFETILRFFGKKQIIALTGLRRVGKTTLMLKLVDYLLKKGFDARKILFFSFDEFPDVLIKEIISEFEQNFGFDGKNKDYYIFFDEIQKVENWENQLKTIYDLNPNLRIIVSGSESLFIKTKSKETLAGRIFDFMISPLSFKEFLGFKNKKFSNFFLHKKELLILFNEYLLTQGFPELIGEMDKEFIRKYISEGIIDKVLYKDLQRMFKIKDMAGFESVFKIIMNDPGQIIEINELAKQLGMQRAIVSNYLVLLEKAFLIKRLFNYSKNERKSARKLKKYYPVILPTTLLFKEDSSSKSIVFESFIVNQLQGNFFWRDQYKNEVDVILTEKELLPVEIKCGRIELKGIQEFMKQFNLKKGIILTLNEEKEINEKRFSLKVIPAWKWLLEKE